MSRIRTYLITGLLALSLGVTMTAVPVEAEVQFKRVKPPKPGAKKRITIQVTAPWPPPLPKDKKQDKPNNATLTAATIPDGTENKGAKEQAWFWSVIPPELDASDPERIETALIHLNGNAAEVAKLGISETRIRDVAKKHGLDILKATLGHSISPAFVLAVIEVESGGVIKAQSEKGAQGLMQLIPATAARFGVKDVNTPYDNITGGVKYLDWLLREFKGDPLHALAGYNAGENAVKKAGGVPEYVETRRYVPKVIAAWGIARTLCITPPRQVRDGCVLKSDLVVKK